MGVHAPGTRYVDVRAREACSRRAFARRTATLIPYPHRPQQTTAAATHRAITIASHLPAGPGSPWFRFRTVGRPWASEGKRTRALRPSHLGTLDSEPPARGATTSGHEKGPARSGGCA